MGELLRNKDISRLTKLTPREIKYYVSEAKLIKPTRVEEQGNKTIFLYDNETALKFQEIALYKGLGFSNQAVKEIIGDENFNYKDSINKQIKILRKKKEEIEDKLISLEKIRLMANSFEEYGMDDYKSEFTDFDFNTDIGKDILEMNSAPGDVSEVLDFLNIENIDTNSAWGKGLELMQEFREKDEVKPDDPFVMQLAHIFNKFVSNMYGDDDIDWEFKKYFPLSMLNIFRYINLDRFIDISTRKNNFIDTFEKSIELDLEKNKDKYK